jgi:hypothetical protein
LVGWSVSQLVGRLVTGKSHECHAASFSFFTRARPSRPFYALRVTPKTALNFGWLVGWLVGHGEVTRTPRCLFSFVTQARHSRPFYALRDTPKTALNFGWLIGWLVDRSVHWSVRRSRGSHTNVTLPLQFRHPGPSFLTLRLPAGHPQNGLEFWSVGHREVMRRSFCLFSFVTRARPSRPFYALRDTPKTVLKFGRLVGRSVTGKSHEPHAASSVLSPGPALSDPSTPCRPPPKWS